MKSILVGALLLVSFPAAFAEEVDVHAVWMELSAKCQNVARGMMGVGPHTDPDELGFDADRVVIDVLLDQLVDAGELVKVEMLIKKPSEMTEENGADLIGFVKTLSEKYGFYVASEMMDIGFRLELDPIEADKPLALKLRIPAKTAEEFKAFVKERGMAAGKE